MTDTVYSLDDYDKVYLACEKRGEMVTPEMFGCPDFHHGPNGEVNYWFHNPHIINDKPVDLTPKDTSYDWARDEAWEDHGYDNLSKGWDRSRTYGELMEAWKIHEEFN